MSLFPIYDSIKKEDEIIENPFSIVEYKIETIANRINNIDSFTDEEIKDIIIRQHSMILNYDLFLSNEENRKYALSLFTNKRFLNIFYSVIRSISLVSGGKSTGLTDHEIICFNKLAYDYYNFPEKDNEICNMLYNISTEINFKDINRLACFVGMENAKILSMIRRSSFKEAKNIHRVNNFLVRCNLDLSVQNIIDLYCSIFSDRFGLLFTNTMLENKPKNLTEIELKKFDNISLAILSIAESLRMEDIKKILYDFYFILNSNSENKYVRFSLNTVNGYPRIIKAVKELKITDDICLP